MSKSKVKWTSKSHIPRYKNLPRCHFRIIHGSFWEKLFVVTDLTGGFCGNYPRVRNCPLRIKKGKFEGYCKRADCLLDINCGCCFWCPFAYKERLKNVFQK